MTSNHTHILGRVQKVVNSMYKMGHHTMPSQSYFMPAKLVVGRMVKLLSEVGLEREVSAAMYIV